jgi:hypothetical protein
MRKKLLLLFYLFTTFPILLAQHTVVMKTGEKLGGKILELKNSKIIFVFKGNNITIEQKDVSAIYFDGSITDKKIDSKQPASIAGVVTYFFNDNYGFKPDVGSNIFIVNNKYTKIDSSALLIMLYYQISVKRKEALSLLGSGITKDDEENTDRLDVMADSIRKIVKNNMHTIKLTADGNGSYSRQLDPGLYSILIVSKHRNANSKTELFGKIHLEIIRFESGKQYSVNAEFEL